MVIVCQPFEGSARSGVQPFEALLDQFTPLIANMVRTFHAPGRPYPDKDDLAQVAMIALWEACSRCSDWATFPAYAKQAVKRALIDLVEDQFNRNPPLRLNATLPNESGLTLLDAVVAPTGDHDLRLAVKQSLARLPRKQALNLWAVKGLGWPAAAWARAHGQHVNTVMQSITRGRHNFRKAWQRAPA